MARLTRIEVKKLYVEFPPLELLDKQNEMKKQTLEKNTFTTYIDKVLEILRRKGE